MPNSSGLSGHLRDKDFGLFNSVSSLCRLFVKVFDSFGRFGERYLSTNAERGVVIVELSYTNRRGG